METKLPAFMQSCLWSYDITSFDKVKDKKLIITQALNHGTPQQIQWVKNNYSDSEIRDVVTHPTRGMWFRERPREWLHRFEDTIDPVEYELAIRETTLKPLSLIEEFLKRVDGGSRRATRALA